MKNLFLTGFAVGLIALGCHPGNGVFAAADSHASGKTTPVAVVDALDAGRWAHSPVEIDNATVSGDTLTLGVTYTGGCKVHDFELVVSSGIVQTQPPRAGALLAHRNNGDVCDVAVAETLRFDLAPLRAALEGNGEDRVILALGDLGLTYDLTGGAGAR